MSEKNIYRKFLIIAGELEAEYAYSPAEILADLLIAGIAYGKAVGATTEQMLDFLETAKERVRNEANAGKWRG